MPSVFFVINTLLFIDVQKADAHNNSHQAFLCSGKRIGPAAARAVDRKRG